MRQLDFIEAWTKGRVKFERHSGGEIVPGYEVWKATEAGVLDVGLSCTCYSMDRSWTSGMYCASPGLGPVEKLAFYHGTPNVVNTKNFRTKVWKQFEQCVAKHYNGLIVLPGTMHSTETFLYSRKPVNTVEDLKKLKLRSVGIRADVFKYAGCNVVGMPSGEVVAALDRGVIDAAEFAFFWGDMALGFGPVSKYVYFNPYTAVPAYAIALINPKVWAKVPPDLKKQIEEASFECAKWSFIECLMNDFLMMKKVETEYKAKVRVIPMEVGKYVHEKAIEFYNKKRKTDPELDAYMKEYDDFFSPKNYGNYVKYIKSLL